MHSPRTEAAGSGLGLYIARDLLQRQHATLTLTNGPQGGLRAVVQIKNTTG